MIWAARLQAYKDTGSGAAPAGGNVRIIKSSWDPLQPGQTVGGPSQLPCADADRAVVHGAFADACGASYVPNRGGHVAVLDE